MYIYIYVYIYIYIRYIYIYIYMFRPSQDSPVRLGSTNREQMMSPECSKQGAEFCQIACGERTNIKLVLISVLQSAHKFGACISADMYFVLPRTHQCGLDQ